MIVLYTCRGYPVKDKETLEKKEPELKVHETMKSSEEYEVRPIAAAAPATDEEIDRVLVNFEKMLSLGVAYSATVGGTATLTGTPPNLVFAKLANKYTFPVATNYPPFSRVLILLTFVHYSYSFSAE